MTEPAADRQSGGAWSKVRQRKVVQWGIAYLAGAWGFLQGLEYLSETYGWSPQLRMIAVPALLLGLPVVLVVAWYHGDRGDQRVTRAEFVILTLWVAVATGIVWRYHLAIESSSVVTAQAAQGRQPAAATSPTVDPRPSIAVLPFENRSGNQDDVFFVDGIQDDILTQLTKVRGLRVIASTSVEKLRGSSLSAREIGQKLGVTKLLQGLVQRAGDRVRINVLLVDAATESQDWAERYDRDLTRANVLAIQSEVAVTVSARLKASLPAAEPSGPEASSTRNLEAWEAYQRGRNGENLADKEQNFRRAIEADPKFAPAYVGLSNVLMSQIYASGARRDINLPEAEAAIETALQLDPKSAEALTASADFAMDREGIDAATAKLLEAIEINPNFAPAYERLSDLLFEAGRVDEALRYAEKGVALDPLSTGLRESLAQSLQAAGRYDDAEVQYRRAVEIEPSDPAALQALAMFEAYLRDRFVLAVSLQEKAVRLAPDNAFLVGTLAMLYMDLEDDARAAELLDAATNRWPDRTNVNVMAAFLAIYRGDQMSASRYATKVLETSPKHTAGVYILVRADLARSDFAAARARFAFANPGFLAGMPPEVNARNYGDAIMAASILLASREDQGRARVLLDRAERALRATPRLGENGYGATDAEIHILRGEKAEAVRSLRAAVKAGWRGPFWRMLELERNFVPLHGDPGYEAAVAEIRRDMAKQRAELAAQTRDGP